MSTLPLHPVLVHLPIGLSLVLPLIFVALLIMEKKGMITPRMWILAVALQGVVAISAFAAMQVGKQDAEKIEPVVNEATIEQHEELGETFFWASLGAMALTLSAVYLRKVPQLKLAATAGSALMLIPLFLAGHSGGKLVYEHGAASAYVSKLPAGGNPEGQVPTSKVDSDD